MRYFGAIVLISAATLPVLLGMSSAGVAQSSDTQPRSSDDGPPPGACTPIGITVSGEVVFPLTCRDFIEKHKAADRASSAGEAKPATAEASKAPEVVETAKTPAAEAVKAPAAAEASAAPLVVEAGKPVTTGEVSNAPGTADVSSAPAVVEASKAPISPDSAGLGDNPGPAPAKAPADEATRPEPATKQAAVAPDSADTGKSSAEPATTATVEKRSRNRRRFAGSADCTRYRTYNAASGTYRDFGGRRRSCP